MFNWLEKFVPDLQYRKCQRI